MLEKCPKQNMIIGIGCLIVVTVIVLIIESRWTDENRKSKKFIIENNSTCWQHEPYTIIQECHPCTDFEINSKSLGVCIHTHNKEVLRCKSGETVTRSCDKVAWLDERRFWIFEISLMCIGLISSILAYLRQKQLDYHSAQRINRQIYRSS